MRENRMKRLWRRGEPALGGWLTVPSSFSAQIFAHAGFDWACIDMQHGVIDYRDAVPMLQAISATETAPLVRVPWNEHGIIMKALDAGAYGIIVPMVNTPAQAEAAAAACRYAPRGVRSYGPTLARFYGREYFSRADEEIACIVMIETREAIENVDQILAVPGIDAAYVGPADLSISLGLAPASDHEEPAFVQALERLLEACRRHQVVPGYHGGNVATARKRIGEGFLMVEVCSDAEALGRAAAADLKALRAGPPGEERSALA
ncbi:MAG: aldolase/citrate lyase family protein [Dehalococcoidia bacterium]|nr:aldolase/citrate lyase family protein [Dehalococcoidia bacterium]